MDVSLARDMLAIRDIDMPQPFQSCEVNHPRVGDLITPSQSKFLELWQLRDVAQPIVGNIVTRDGEAS